MIERVMKSRAIGVAMGVVVLGVGAGVLAGMGDRQADERGAVMDEFSDQVEWVSMDHRDSGEVIDDQLISGRVWIEAVIFGPSVGRVVVEDSLGNDVVMSPAYYYPTETAVVMPTRIDLGIAVDGVRVRRVLNDNWFSGPITIIYRRSLTGPARADVTTSGTNPGDAGYGRPDGVVDVADLTFFVEQWTGGPIA